METTKNVLDILEFLLKFAAFFAAAGFFGYKLLTGWLIINMGVIVRVERQVITGSGRQDHLGITVALEKGKTDSVWLHDVQVRISPMVNGVPDTANAIFRDIYGYQPIGERTELIQGTEFGKANWAGIPRNEPIAISPDKKLEFSGHAIVSTGIPYFVEVVVFGNNKLYVWRMKRYIQWRSSAIALPTSKSTETLEPLETLGGSAPATNNP